MTSETTQAKPPAKIKAEYILATWAESFDPKIFSSYVNPYGYDVWLKEVSGKLIVAQREALEKDERFRQILPYIFYRKVINGVTHYFTYQRTKNVGEKKLGMKYSIGIGGHIDIIRVIFNEDSTIDLGTTIIHNNEIETAEEISYSLTTGGMITQVPDPKPMDLFLIHDVDVQIVHAGVVFVVDVPENFEVECAEEELRTVGWETLETLASGKYDLEVWSALLVNYLLRLEQDNDRVPNAEVLTPEQRYEIFIKDNPTQAFAWAHDTPEHARHASLDDKGIARTRLWPRETPMPAEPIAHHLV